jgi:hypothetical protein
MNAATEQRQRLRGAGFSPIPVQGKIPTLEAWQKKVDTNADEIELWERVFPHAASTGVLTRATPTIDIDILNPAAAEAIEALAQERFEERGYVLIRIGQPPKRAILLRTDAPFKKIVGNVIAPDGSQQKIELLGDGQQVVVSGIHPTTGKPYSWHGGEPGQIKWADLPYVTEAEARAFVGDAVQLLVREHGFKVANARPKDRENGNVGGWNCTGGPADWTLLSANIRDGRELHDSICAYAAKLIVSGMADGAAINLIRGMMENSTAPHDERWQERYEDIPRAVTTARQKCTSADGGIAQGRDGVIRETGRKDADLLRPDSSNAILQLSDWLKRDLPSPDYISGWWLTTTSRVMLYAPTGAGKTMIAIAVSIRAAEGLPFLHWKGRRPRKVLYVDGEMSRRLMKQRLVDEVGRLGGAIPSGFHILNHEDVENFAPLSTEQGRRTIENELEKMGGADLIVFDNIMSLIGGDMKEEESWRQTLPWQHALTRRNIGQLWLHHTGHDETKSYGTKTREWQLDTVIKCEKIKRDDTDVSFKLSFPKARERTPITRADFADLDVALVDNEWTHSGGKANSSAKRLSPVGAKFLAALVDALAGPDTVIRDGRQCATMESWRRECVTLGLIDLEAKPDSARTLFSKHRRELVACNVIACNNDVAWKI